APAAPASAAPAIAALTIKEPEPAGPAQAQQAMPAIEDKPLVDAMKVQVSNTAYAADTGAAEDATINLNYLINHKDPACKEAGTNFQKALETYKKAINDVKELGAERNKLLQAAADGFDKGITGLEKVLEKTPDPAIDRVMQQVAMIMYACLKYQSL
ncbi:MAG: hypothetical protein KIS92_22525, partial [Planctomycetota bacterium]|nr:hypothetical protein [Planctomycetota bacterium]